MFILLGRVIVMMCNINAIFSQENKDGTKLSKFSLSIVSSSIANTGGLRCCL